MKFGEVVKKITTFDLRNITGKTTFYYIGQVFCKLYTDIHTDITLFSFQIFYGMENLLVWHVYIPLIFNTFTNRINILLLLRQFISSWWDFQIFTMLCGPVTSLISFKIERLLLFIRLVDFQNALSLLHNSLLALILFLVHPHCNRWISQHL